VLRELQGLTLEELATRVHTSNQQISHLEMGKRRLTLDWLLRIAAALDCHPWALVDGQDVKEFYCTNNPDLEEFQKLIEAGK